MARYIDIEDVRRITAYDLDEDTISDERLTHILDFAISELNQTLGLKVIEEKVSYIDRYRQNKIDGSNKTFYVKYSFDWYLGDLDCDGNLDTNDIEVYIYDPNDNTRTKAVVSELYEYGKFVLDEAPSSSQVVKVTYLRFPCSLFDPLVKKACAELAASIAYGGIEAREKKRLSIRGFSLSKDPIAEQKYYERYLRTVAQILAREPAKHIKAEPELYAPGLFGARRPPHGPPKLGKVRGGW